MDRITMKETVKGTLTVVAAISLVLAPYSLLIGWNLITLLLFWFVIVPLVAFYIPTKVSRNNVHLVESLLGLLIFYILIAFMIYDHYQSDYFLVMMASCLVNLIVVTAISLTKKGTQTV